jgi:glycosyltransferase involved in cell wall biosynthesis
MRIVIIADPLDNQKAGVHIYTRAVVMELSKNNRGHEIILIRHKKDNQWPNLKQIIIPVSKIPGFASLRLFFIIPFQIRKLKADLVIEPAHFGPFNLPISIKRLTVIHDLTPIKFPQYHRWHSQILQKIFLGTILKNTDYVITNSKHTSLDLEHYYPITKDKNKAIPLAVDEIFKPMQDVKLPNNLNISGPYFINVGTLEPRKNTLKLLEAYYQFRSKTDYKHKLIIIGGDGWKIKYILQAIANHPYKNDIIRLGHVKKTLLPLLYSHATSLIYPSHYEGFGLPILEAMSCGCPVICSNTSSMPEVAGELGYYIDPEKSEDIYKQMKALAALNIEDKKLLLATSKNRASLFSWEKHVDELLEYIT